MDETCTAADGSDMYTFGLTPNRVMILMGFLGLAPLAIILGGPKLVRYLGSLIGQYVHSKTAGRKKYILGQVESDRKAFFEAQKDVRRDSDEWENVEAYAKGAAKSEGEKGDEDWDGIVGFFHPFW
jgi:alpha-1,2-mannosyltransferase